MIEKEILKALGGGLGLAGKLVGRSVDEVTRAVKGSGDDGPALAATGLFHAVTEPGSSLRPRARWNETQVGSKLSVNLLKGLTMSGGEREFLAGLGHMLAGRLPAAVDSLREATRRGESKIQVTDAFYVLGVLLLHVGEGDEASRHLHTALMAQQGLGRGLKRWCPSFHLSLALSDFSSFLLGPDLIGLTVALALAQSERDPEESVRTLDQLLELVPGEPTALFFTSLLRFRQGRHREVFSLLARTLPDSNLHIAYMLLLGLSVARLGDASTARELFKKATGVSGLDATLSLDLRVALAHTAREAGALGESDSELETVLRKSPGYVSFERRWGMSLDQPAAESPIPSAAEEATAAPVAPPPPVGPVRPAGPVTLIDNSGSATRLVTPDGALEVLLNRAPFTLGREADVALDSDEAASRHHARVSFADGDFWIEDLGSANGTWVNRHRIRRPVELHRGDIVEIGQHRFEVR